MSKRSEAYKSIDILDYTDPETCSEVTWELININLQQMIASEGWTPNAVFLAERRNNVYDHMNVRARYVFYCVLSSKQRWFIRFHGGENAWLKHSTERLRHYGKNLTLDEAKNPWVRNMLIVEKVRAHYAM